jgi:monoamine oxidase
VSELLAKAIGRGALDQELTAHDKERVLAFLVQYGDLSPDLLYKGSARSGYKTEPGAGSQAGVLQDPLSLQVLLDEDLWNGAVFEELIDQQATMFQPVGGMDRLPAAFEARLEGAIRHNCEVTAVRRTGSGVSVEFRNPNTGRSDVVDAQYCIATLPPAILAKIPSDFSAPYREALASFDALPAVKIAWQARRFWEQDFGIYGGISWVHGPTSMVWYPSCDLFSDRGVLIGAYTSGDLGAWLSRKSLHEQFDLSRQAVERLHPGHGQELQKPMGISWSKIAYSLGEGAVHRDGDSTAYELLNRPDGPFYFAGDYLSHLGTWQESAIASARYAINGLDEHRRAST